MRSRARELRELRASFLPWALLVLVWGTGCAAPADSRQTATVPVYFATTRAVAASATPEKAFTAAIAEQRGARHGRALVELGPKARIVSYDPPLADNQSLLPGKFNSEVRSQFSKERPLVVYLHGFNNSFATAAHRAALFAHELQPNVAARPVIYSWPSASKVLAYARDEETALLNQENVRRFLDGLHDGDATTPAVLIGHSLGARALTYALRDIFLFNAKQIDPTRPMFAHLVLLEADVNRIYFRANLLRASALCGRITIYSSKHDLALGASKFVHGGHYRLGQRIESHEDNVLGEMVPDRIAKKIDVIDASAVRSDLFGHAYDQPVLFEDLRALIRGKNAAEREGHTLEKDPTGRFYRLLRTPRT
jgi:esterase/lipase superfamily enzyme